MTSELNKIIYTVWKNRFNLTVMEPQVLNINSYHMVQDLTAYTAMTIPYMYNEVDEWRQFSNRLISRCSKIESLDERNKRLEDEDKLLEDAISFYKQCEDEDTLLREATNV